jgi:CysZ protein
MPPVAIHRDYDARRASPLYHFAAGIRFFFAGLPLLFRHPALLGLSLLPVLLTLIAIGSIGAASIYAAGRYFGGELRLITQALVLLAVLLLGYVIYLPLARVLLAPFSEALSRRAHLVATGARMSRPAGGWARAMLEGLKLVLLQMVVGVLALAASLIFPPIGAPIGVLTAIFIVGLDYLDVPLSARGLKLREKLALVWRHKSAAAGFGLAGYLLLLIPIVNLFSLPVGVIGATLLATRLPQTSDLRRQTTDHRHQTLGAGSPGPNPKSEV